MSEAHNAREVARAFAHPNAAPVVTSSAQRSVDAKHAAQQQVPWAALRAQAYDIKAYSIGNLDRLLVQFEAQFTARGGTVLWAPTAHDAVAHILDICRRHGANAMVKGKSMVSEELALNERLGEAGVAAIETDLGEYIVQLAGQRPSHILGPALHLSRQEIGRIFVEKLGIAYSDDPHQLMSAARVRLRERYLDAQVGMTGVNFAIAQTGTVVVVENEGNGGLCSAVPPVHVFLMGIEKLIPRLSDLPVFLSLLARAATGQKLTSYTHHFLGPEAGKTAYCVILDGGRTNLLADPKTRQSLSCIRCGACLNVCPIYRRAGGWSYGWVYPGPIGSVITPPMLGLEQSAELPYTSTLCGACKEECPVNIDLPHQLVYLRHKVVEKRLPGRAAERRAFALWAGAMRDSASYRRGVTYMRRALQLGRRIGWYPGPLGVWTRNRKLPALAAQSFKEWWENR